MCENFLIRKRLRECREQKGFSRAQVSKMTEISARTIAFWENERCLPPLDKVIKLANLYDVSIDYLANRTDNPEVNK